jgi:putative ABC transport system permease protein
MVINKRVKRELKENIVRYIGLFLLVLLGVSIIIGFAASTDSINHTVDQAADRNLLEDGHFQTKSELSMEKLSQLRELGIVVNKELYIDYKLNENQTIRLFKEREDLNQISIVKGKDIKNDGEILIDKHFGEKNSYRVNDYITIENLEYKVVGYGITPDYTLVIDKISNLLADPQLFGIGFLNENDFYQLVKDKNSERKTLTQSTSVTSSLQADESTLVNYGYSFRYNDTKLSDEQRKDIDASIKELVSEETMLTSFYKTDDNPRTTSYREDIAINKQVAVVLGVVLLLIIAFIFGLSVLHIIDKESAVIGALYSLGYVKKDIIRHFMILPVAITTVASILGTVLGFLTFTYLAADSSYEYFSYPNLKIAYEPYLFIFGIVSPILITTVINYLMLSKRLKLTPLRLLRKDIKKDSFRNVKLHHLKFINKFRLRIFLREIRNNITLFIGILFATYLLLMGLGVQDSIRYYVQDVSEHSVSQYMYILRQPVDITEDTKVEEAYLKELSIYYKDLEKDVGLSIVGIPSQSQFINLTIPSTEEGIYISNAVSKKFNLNRGDLITLSDTNSGKEYEIRVIGTYDYPEGLYCFMNIDVLRNLMKQDKGYYNIVYSDSELDIDRSNVISCITPNQLKDTANNMSEMMMSMIILLISLAVVIYIIVMYLLLKMIIDKSSNHISLIKIFGYQSKEINKLYLGSIFYTVLLSVIISIPIDITILKVIWPFCISNIQGFIFIKIQPITYLIIIGFAMVCYLVTNVLLKMHLRKVSLGLILKDRE